MTTVSAELMSLAEAAARLQVDPKTVRRYIAAGRLTGYRLGDHMIRLDAAEVDALLRPIATRRSSSTTNTDARTRARIEALRWALNIEESKPGEYGLTPRRLTST